MQLKPEEISKVIRSQIKYYDNAIQQNETGTVLMVGDGIARASGLVNCMAGELLEFEDGSFGMAQNLEENSVSIVLFGSDENISEGQTVKRTGKVVSVPVGKAMIGRVVNPGTADRRRRPHRDGGIPPDREPGSRYLREKKRIGAASDRYQSYRLYDSDWTRTA